MGRGGLTYLSYTATVLLSSASQAYAGLWDVSIDLSPAPAPEDGPPFSANASRDRSLLPYQIAGIVGSYLGSVLIIGLLLVTVGRRLRMKAQTMAGARATEMVKPATRNFDPSPISPVSSRSWYSPRRLAKKKSAPNSLRSVTSNPASPGMDSIVSFDPNVIENDRLKRQDEMERLYAAVMAQDDRKDRKATNSTTELSGPAPPDVPQIAPPEYSRRKPPRLITDAPGLKHLQPPPSNPTSPLHPLTPKSPVRAIYPPDSPMPEMPYSPTSPVRAEYPTAPLTPRYEYQAQPTEPLPTKSRERAASFGSSKTAAYSVAGAGGNKRKLRKSLRQLKISAPLPVDDNSDGARTPLSPRTYADPGVPPEPPTAGTTDTARTADSSQPPWRYGEDHEPLDQVRNLPHPAPQRASSYQYNNEAQALTGQASTRPDPNYHGPQRVSPPSQPRQAGTINNPLPFRQMAHEQRQLQRSQAPNNLQIHPAPQSPYYPGTSLPLPHPPPLSSGPVKTTFLESRRDWLGAPRTGMATPYSPYMPFTPLTPVTPRLPTRAERRQREREENTLRGAPIQEEDAVVEEGEMWGDGW